MNKKERIYAAVRGEKTDRLPYAIWTHLPGIDMDPERLANETYKFFKTYDTDLIKTMNNGMYAIEDFGCEIDYYRKGNELCQQNRALLQRNIS